MTHCNRMIFFRLFLCIPDRIMNANPYSIHTNTHLVHSFVILAVFLCSESGFFSVSVSQLCCEETFFIPHTVVRVFFTSHASPFFGSLSDVRRLFPTFLNFPQLTGRMKWSKQRRKSNRQYWRSMWCQNSYLCCKETFEEACLKSRVCKTTEKQKV